MRSFFRRFIPVYTGQIPEAALIHSYVPVHPHIHGADTKFPKKIPVTEGQLLPPQNPMTESVCIIFSECIFADNTFCRFLFLEIYPPHSPTLFFLPFFFPPSIPFIFVTYSVWLCRRSGKDVFADKKPGSAGTGSGGKVNEG